MGRDNLSEIVRYYDFSQNDDGPWDVDNQCTLRV